MCYCSTAKAAAPKTNTDIGNEDFKAFIWPLGFFDFFFFLMVVFFKREIFVTCLHLKQPPKLAHTFQAQFHTF